MRNCNKFPQRRPRNTQVKCGELWWTSVAAHTMLRGLRSSSAPSAFVFLLRTWQHHSTAQHSSHPYKLHSHSQLYTHSFSLKRKGAKKRNWRMMVVSSQVMGNCCTAGCGGKRNLFCVNQLVDTCIHTRLLLVAVSGDLQGCKDKIRAAAGRQQGAGSVWKQNNNKSNNKKNPQNLW